MLRQGSDAMVSIEFLFFLSHYALEQIPSSQVYPVGQSAHAVPALYIAPSKN